METEFPLGAGVEKESCQDHCSSTHEALNSLSESLYEDLTFLAAQICGTPISLISVTEGERQFIKSKRGLDILETTAFDFYIPTILESSGLFVVNDTLLDSRFTGNPFGLAELNIRFYAGASIVTDAGQILGTICVMDYQPRILTQEQEKSLQALARQTLAHLELTKQIALRTETEVTLRESEERFHAFMDHSSLVAFIKNEQGIYNYVNQPFLQRFDLEMNQVIGHTDFDLWPHAASQVHSVDGKILSDETEDIFSSVEKTRRPDGTIQYWQVYKFALRHCCGQKRLLGGVALDITENKAYEKQLEEYKSRLEETLKQVQAQSLQDGLTGIFNRRALNEKLASEFERAKRYNLSLSLLMIDVDHFKRHNDKFGHLVGDHILQTVANLLKEQARAHDFVGRYGGEEFAIILPNTTDEGAFAFGERCRQAVLDAKWSREQVTISVGSATLNDLMDKMDDFIAAADKALYDAKADGRNRVTKAL